MSVTMADIYRRQRMCSDKSRFATEVEAKCFVLKRNAKLRAYQCPHCNDWHLTKRLTPPCAATGGFMEYRAPEGRPQSTPPMFTNGHDEPEVVVAVKRTSPRRWTGDDAALAAAYKAGRRISDLMREFRCSTGTIYGALEKHSVPTQHAKPEPAAPQKPLRRADENRQAYAQRIIAWKRATDPEYDKQVHKNMRQGQLRRARIARLRKAFSTLPATHRGITPTEPPKPLTLWQRIKAWFA